MTVATATSALVPEVGPPKAIKVPTVAERTLPNGLRVLAARRAGVPRLEARMHVPTARDNDAGDPARLRVMAKTLLSGTSTRSSVTLAEDLQRLGATLDAAADAEDVVVYGSALATNLAAFLELLAEVVTDAAYPPGEVAIERDRIAQEIVLARSQPTTVARDALVRRLYGKHPYGRGLPSPEAVQRIRAPLLRTVHDERLRPEGAILVLVGDFRPDRALDEADKALATWAPGGADPGLPPPGPPRPAPVLLVDRPGAVQTNIRLAGPAIGRADPAYPALALANLIFAGYFTSRLVDNIRERRGYTYSPGSGVHHYRAASHFLVQADVGNDVTAATLVEIRYELGRMVAARAEASELAAAKRYLAGTLAMSIQTQAGLASYLATLASNGLDAGYLRDFPRQAEQLGAAEVQEAAARFLAPRRLLTVMVGDTAHVRTAIEAFDDVDVTPSG